MVLRGYLIAKNPLPSHMKYEQRHNRDKAEETPREDVDAEYCRIQVRIE